VVFEADLTVRGARFFFLCSVL